MSKLETLKKVETLNDLAYLLGYKPKSLSYILYQIPDEQKYTKFTIPKKNGGIREINAPTEKLKKLQSRLASLLSDCYEEINSLPNCRKSIAHGFRKNHSIVTNANNHKNKRYVFNIDLQDFFPSFNFGRVRGFFIKNKHFNLEPKIATIIAQIACFNNELPQGSPCSPVITNLIGHILDIKLVNLAKKAKCTYSRYADDITFSTNQKTFPESIAIKSDTQNWQPSNELVSVVERSRFKINKAKTSMQYKTSRQITTGLVVNKKVNIKRDYYDNARSYCNALFNNAEFFLKNEDIKGTINQLDGILSFIYHIKRPFDKASFGTRRYYPVGITKLYRRFLFYKHFIINTSPVIICEGKTDIIYLKSALINLHNKFNDLITKSEDKNSFKLKFLNFSSNFKDVFAISEGSSGLEFLIKDFKNNRHYIN